MPSFNLKSFSTFTCQAMKIALALAIVSFAFITPVFAAPPVKVAVDEARIIRLSAVARTIIVGNPIIADVNIQDGQILVIMGRSTGTTNLIALDERGNEVANVNIVVQTGSNNSVILYKGSERISMNCAPNCERSLIIGDSPASFDLVKKQIAEKLGAAKAAADFSN